jgi:hypothetical protein
MAGENIYFIPGEPMEGGQKIHIGGIKFSEELVQVTFVGKAPEDPSIHHLLHLIAERNINIAFLCHSIVTKIPECIFCVSLSELDELQHILNIPSLQNEQVSIIPSVGTITFFPHRNDFKLLGLITKLFGSHGFPIHSLSTSISAIALNTDYILLDKIAEKLQDDLALPENHAPFRQGFRVTQIQL